MQALYTLMFLCLLAFTVSPVSANSASSNPQIRQLQKELDKLLLKYTELHPRVVILKKRIADLKKQIQQQDHRDIKPDLEAQPGSDSVDHFAKEVLHAIDDKKNGIPVPPGKKKLTKTGAKEERPPHSIWGNTNRFGKKGALRVPLQIKETAGVGAKSYPITTVSPLPFGRYYKTNQFRLVDSSGNTIPAQFEVLNRWWARDNSLRHIMIHYQPTVSAFTGPGTGITTYYLQDDGSNNAAKTPLKVNQTSDFITVITGPLKFIVNKTHFNILDEVWFDQNKNGEFEDKEKVIHSTPENGGVFIGRLPGDIQRDSSRTDTTFTIEESGPMRVVIRAESVTKYYSPEKHRHGFAVRIYAYANKPFIKIDYQLQNSAKNVVFSWPLYFESLSVDFKLDLGDNPTIRVGLGNGSVYERSLDDGLYLAQEFHNKFKIYDKKTNSVLASGKQADGFIDVTGAKSGVTALIRYFWQTWPNGLAIDSNNTLSFQLFPQWSRQWEQKTGNPHFTETELYWLNDMQHVYKEMVLFFHGPDVKDNRLIDLAKTFQYHPVATLPTAWYKITRATLDMGGFIPVDEKISHTDQRLHHYTKYDFNTKKATEYNFGWNQFLIDVRRKWGASMGGRWPYSVSEFIATQNPSDYYYAEQFAIGELNVRPQWMAQYDFSEDWEFLQLTENPYAGISWRKLKGGDFRRVFDAPFVKDTQISAKPRDDEHGWFYHMKEAYYFTGNPWIKDWYKFIGEFRQTRLHHLDPYTDPVIRATAHALANALQAYQVTGDPALIKGYQRYLNKWLIKYQHPITGSIKRNWKGEYTWQRAGFVGYLARTIITFMHEVRGGNWQAYAEAFQFLSGLMEWNYNYGNFGYQVDATEGQIGSSSAWSQNLADPQAWYFLHTGKKKYLKELLKYIKEGINGGEKIFPGALGYGHGWTGQFQGRYIQFVLNHQKADLTPPDKISDLKAAHHGNHITLTWTAPEGAARYHIVWSNKPISDTTTTNTETINWWATNVIGPDLQPVPDEQQKITFTIPSSLNSFYAAIFTFDENDNMSSMSNLAFVDINNH